MESNQRKYERLIDAYVSKKVVEYTALCLELGISPGDSLYDEDMIERAKREIRAEKLREETAEKLVLEEMLGEELYDVSDLVIISKPKKNWGITKKMLNDVRPSFLQRAYYGMKNMKIPYVMNVLNPGEILMVYAGLDYIRRNAQKIPTDTIIDVDMTYNGVIHSLKKVLSHPSVSQVPFMKTANYLIGKHNRPHKGKWYDRMQTVDWMYVIRFEIILNEEYKCSDIDVRSTEILYKGSSFHDRDIDSIRLTKRHQAGQVYETVVKMWENSRE